MKTFGKDCLTRQKNKCQSRNIFAFALALIQKFAWCEITFKVYSDHANRGAKARKVKEQANKIKE